MSSGRKWRKFCTCIWVNIADLLLFGSAITLVVFGWQLNMMDITALVGESIPEVMFGIAAVIVFIILYGRIADYRKWQLGFYVESFCLIIVFLTEGLVVLWSFFQYSERDSNAVKFWDALDEDGKSLIMANWMCCGWTATCNANGEGIFWTFRAYGDTLCYDATAADYRDYNDAVMIYLGIAAGFHIVFTAIPCICQGKRRQMLMKRKVRKGVDKWKFEEAERKASSMSTNDDTPLVAGGLTFSPSICMKVGPDKENKVRDFSSGDQFSPSTSRDFASRTDNEKQVNIELGDRSSIRMNPLAPDPRQPNENSTEDDESHHLDIQGGSPAGSSDAVRVDRLHKPGNEQNEPSVIALDMSGRGKHKHNLSQDSNGGGVSTPTGMSSSVMPVWADPKDSPKQSINKPNIPDVLAEASEDSSSDKEDDKDGAESTSKGGPMAYGGEAEANVEPVYITYNLPDDKDIANDEKIEGNAGATEANTKPPPAPSMAMSAKDSPNRGDDEPENKEITPNAESAPSGDANVPPPLPSDVNRKKELPTEAYEDGESQGARNHEEKKADVSEPLYEESARNQPTGMVPPTPPHTVDLSKLSDGEDDQEDVQEDQENRSYK